MAEREEIKNYIKEKLDEGMPPLILRSALIEVKIDTSILDEVLDERSIRTRTENSESKKLPVSEKELEHLSYKSFAPPGFVVVLFFIIFGFVVEWFIPLGMTGFSLVIGFIYWFSGWNKKILWFIMGMGINLMLKLIVLIIIFRKYT